MLHWIRSGSIVPLNPALYLLSSFATTKYHFSEEETPAAVLGHLDAINIDQNSLSNLYTMSYSIIRGK